MNELTTLTNNLTPIEVLLKVDENGTVSAKDVYEFLELVASNYSRWCKNNIVENQFAEENVDFTAFVINDEWGGQATTDYRLSASFAKKLCMKQGNERGEQAREYFIKVEDKLKETASRPLTQAEVLLAQAQALVDIEKKQVEQQAAIDTVNTRLDTIGDIVSLSPTAWREDSKRLIVRIAQALGGNSFIRDVQAEVYHLMRERFSVDVKTRRTNMRRRAAEEGMCQSKRDKLSCVDAIAQDKKAIEAYLAILKDMAIRYGVDKGGVVQ